MNLNIKNIFVLALLAGPLLNNSHAEAGSETKENKVELTGPWLGQKPPGLTPEVFAPGIISTPGWEYGVVFAPDMTEMYFVREVNADSNPQQQFVVFESQLGEQHEGDQQKEEGQQVWTERVISPRVGTPTLSPDNKTLFFGRSYKTRTKNDWSEMKTLGPDFKDIRIMRVTSSFDGTIAFDEAGRDGNGILRYSTFKNGKRQPPKPFPKQINTGEWNAHPFIAPDESYVIWDGQRDSKMRNAELFISFKNPDGSWGEAIKFGGEINTLASEFAAQVTPDGKYLFFNRNVGKDNTDTFWVDAQVIEQLKPAHIKKYMATQAPKATATQVVGSFWDLPLLEKAFIDTAPQSADSNLVAGKLPLSSEKTAAITQLVEEIGEGKHGSYDSMLIAHNNKLVFESYHLRGRHNMAHPQASAVKAYTSLIVGRAMQLGYLTMEDLHKPLINFLPDVEKEKLVEGAERITLHKALTMHGGLNVEDEKWQELEKTPEVLQGQGLVQSLLEHSAPVTEESQIYNYGNYNPMLVMTVVDAVVPGTARDFIKSEFLDKLNISNYQWQDHISGLPQAGWMASFTSRDMLKFGNIVVNNGKWQGKQFIPVEYLKKATSGLIKPNIDWMPEEYRYGYFWYYTPVQVDGKNMDVAFAWGGGGQRVIVVEELDLVIAITGHDRDDKIMQQISEIVIPAFAG